MSKSEIILEWLVKQAEAGKITWAEGAKLADSVDMSDATDAAEISLFVLREFARRVYVNVGRKADVTGFKPEYDNNYMRETISARLHCINNPGPSELAQQAVLLIASGILENDITKAQARRLLLSLDQEREKAWGQQSAFNSAFDKCKVGIGTADILLYKGVILRSYTIIRDTK